MLEQQCTFVQPFFPLFDHFYTLHFLCLRQ